MNRVPVKAYTSLLTGLSAASILALIVIITRLDPYSGMGAVFIFYLDLFFLSLTLASLSAYYLRQSFGQREHARRDFLVSLRQGIWFSILITVSMSLQSYDLFSIINALLLALALIFLEAYFLYNKQT